ncbi:MAG: hypothetical protein KKB39_02670 [Nanoarchaeota archaeon]|nr:hypothetical protein [Nanoarchaeota archaeon]
MKKTAILLFILSLAILITGCDSGTSNVSSGYYKYTGPQMIEAKFVADAPISMENAPYEQNEDIDVVVQLTNKHTEEIPAGKVRVRLTGDAAMPNFFVGGKEATNPKLLSIDPETGAAIPEEVDLGPIKYTNEVLGKIQKTITGKYCYSYPVTVKANLFYTAKAEEIGTNLPSGSNPPSKVQVTAITQRPVDIREGVGSMRFEVTVANTGTGIIVPTLDDCFQYRGRREKEVLTIDAMGAYNIECDEEVTLMTDTKSKTVDCTVSNIDPANLGEQPSELTIVLNNFAYEEDIAPVSIWLEGQV